MATSENGVDTLDKNNLGIQFSKLRRLCFRKISAVMPFHWFSDHDFFIACLYMETIGFIVVVEACDHDVMQYDE